MFDMRVRQPAIFVALIVAVYLWLGAAMLLFRSPMLAMIVYYPVFCLGGGLLIRSSLPASARQLPESATSPLPFATIVGLAFALSVALWACTLLFRPGLVDPGILSEGLCSIGMTRERFWLSAGFLAAVNPFAEEYLWRWSVFPFLASRLPRSTAVHLSSLMFAGYHPLVVGMLFPSAWLLAVFAISYAGGVILAKTLLRTGRLGYPIALHLVINANLMIIGFLYSPSSTP